ncbi:MAG: 5'/3'-nucleotidase SurE [Phycisphaerales bacterium]|nr:MAG: 5'/3'-nucleotidase SurE [Phycisphaerales bacterium]
MHFALTNDDGYDARGLAELVRVAREYGTTDIVAPLSSQSQTSHSISLNRTVSVRSFEHLGLGRVHGVAGRPADCTRLALAGLASGRQPDWVLSGINHGANLGVDVYYSGTVAAAREAAILGVPAAAFSQLIRRPQPVDWEGAGIMAHRVLEHIFKDGCPPGSFFNINLPALATGFESAPLVEVPVATEAMPLQYEPVDTPTEPNAVPEGCIHYRYAGRYLDRGRSPGTDVDVAFADQITISRINLRM